MDTGKNKTTSLANNLRQKLSAQKQMVSTSETKNEPVSSTEQVDIPEPTQEPVAEESVKNQTKSESEKEDIINVHKPNERKEGKKDKKQGVIEGIKGLSYKEETTRTTLLIPESIQKQLKILQLDNISIQKLAIYAINELLETNELKKHMENVRKNL